MSAAEITNVDSRSHCIIGVVELQRTSTGDVACIPKPALTSKAEESNTRAGDRSEVFVACNRMPESGICVIELQRRGASGMGAEWVQMV